MKQKKHRMLWPLQQQLGQASSEGRYRALQQGRLLHTSLLYVQCITYITSNAL